jgi:hypothetical protein
MLSRLAWAGSCLSPSSFSYFMKRKGRSRIAIQRRLKMQLAVAGMSTRFVTSEEIDERAIQHWERACELEGIGKRRNAALYLARLYVDEAIVRNLPRGLELFREVYKDTRGYEPSLCSYVDGLFKAGEFDEAIRIGQDLHTRAIQEYPDPTQRPDAPIYLVAKAYRAKVKTCKKNGQLAEALETSNGLLATGVATDNDRSIHEGLLGSVR